MQKFIAERGYPAWNEGSAFYSNQQPVLLIPVIRPAEKNVTGAVYISIVDGDPFFRWIPRGIQANLEGFPNSESLEILMLGYEHRLFGKEQNGELRIHQKEDRNSNTPEERSSSKQTPTTIWIEVSYTTCTGVDAGANGDTHWECETTYEWTSVQVDSQGSGSGSGGSDGSPPDPVPPIPGDAQNEPFSIGIGVDTERLDEFPKLKCVVD